MSQAKLECILSLYLHYNTKYLMKILFFKFNHISSLFIRIVNQTMYEPTPINRPRKLAVLIKRRKLKFDNILDDSTSSEAPSESSTISSVHVAASTPDTNSKVSHLFF